MFLIIKIRIIPTIIHPFLRFNYYAAPIIHFLDYLNNNFHIFSIIYHTQWITQILSLERSEETKINTQEPIINPLSPSTVQSCYTWHIYIYLDYIIQLYYTYRCVLCTRLAMCPMASGLLRRALSRPDGANISQQVGSNVWRAV